MSAPHDHVVITGTSGGIGSALAADLLARGYRVTGIARRRPSVDFRGDYCHVEADLAELDALPDLARVIIEQRGTPYALVNNAARGLDGLLPITPDPAIRSVIDLDLVSPILLTKHMARPMLSHGRGRIVMITSIVASGGFRGLSVYSAAKAGLEGFTRSLARDVGKRGVTVNAVAPGFIDTDMTSGISDQNFSRIRARSALGRAAEPSEVCAAVAYLLSGDAAGVTGATLTVDAGATA